MMARLVYAALICALLGSPHSIAADASPHDRPAYRIVSQDGPTEAVRVSVRLDARQSQDKLKSIAEDVRARLPTGKIVRDVKFYLSAMALSEPAWAEVKLTPTVSVTIAGVRLDEEEAFRTEAATDVRPRVGMWLTSPPALAGRLTIFRDKKGAFTAEWALRNGQTTTDTLDEVRTSRGRRYVVIGGDGSYYQLSSNGRLELGAGGRVIAIAEPLNPIEPKPADKFAAPALALPVKGAAPSVLTSSSAAQTPVAATVEPMTPNQTLSHDAKPTPRRAVLVRKKPTLSTVSTGRHADASLHDAISGAFSR